VSSEALLVVVAASSKLQLAVGETENPGSPTPLIEVRTGSRWKRGVPEEIAEQR
jgi:hypothetical protein